LDYQNDAENAWRPERVWKYLWRQRKRVCDLVRIPAGSKRAKIEDEERLETLANLTRHRRLLIPTLEGTLTYNWK
jgi:hypothetical protein